jgi:hypothetical protein
MDARMDTPLQARYANTAIALPWRIALLLLGRDGLLLGMGLQLRSARAGDTHFNQSMETR